MSDEPAKHPPKQNRADLARRAREISSELNVIRGDKSQSARADKLVDEFIEIVDSLSADDP